MTVPRVEKLSGTSGEQPEKLEKLFERMEREKTAARLKSMGERLSLIRQMSV